MNTCQYDSIHPAKYLFHLCKYLLIYNIIFVQPGSLKMKHIPNVNGYFFKRKINVFLIYLKYCHHNSINAEDELELLIKVIFVRMELKN